MQLSNGRLQTIAIAALAALFAGSVVWAIPAPQSRANLQRDASLIIDGEVVKVTYLKHNRNGNYATATYVAQVRVTNVMKGSIRVGALVPLHFIVESWVGGGRKPPGRTPRAIYSACEQVRLFLHAGKTYSLVAWNAKRTLKLPARTRWPNARHRVVRCVNGQPR